MTVKIDKGIAKPEGAERGRTKWPWEEMAIGDSFLHTGTRQAAHQAALYRSAKGSKKFSYATMPDGTLRIWRDA